MNTNRRNFLKGAASIAALSGAGAAASLREPSLVSPVNVPIPADFTLERLILRLYTYTKFWEEQEGVRPWSCGKPYSIWKYAPAIRRFGGTFGSVDPVVVTRFSENDELLSRHVKSNALQSLEYRSLDKELMDRVYANPELAGPLDDIVSQAGGRPYEMALLHHYVPHFPWGKVENPTPMFCMGISEAVEPNGFRALRVHFLTGWNIPGVLRLSIPISITLAPVRNGEMKDHWLGTTRLYLRDECRIPLEELLSDANDLPITSREDRHEC